MPRKPVLSPTPLSELSARLERRTTVPERVATALRDLILAGDLRPGDAVVESKIARQLGVGQPTVREALKTLESEGLLTRQPNRGCSVTKLSSAELDMIARLRVEFESLAVSLVMETWRADKAVALEQAAQAMRAAAAAGEPGEGEAGPLSSEAVRAYMQSDLEFHRTLWRLAENPYLERALNQITVPQFAFSTVMLGGRRGFSLRENARDHAAIIEAILSGDREHAIATTRKMLQRFRDTDRRLLD